MKTKIITMTALVALLATGCGKDENNGVNNDGLKLFAEKMTDASGSKLQIDPNDPANSVQWFNGENLNINGEVREIHNERVKIDGIDLSDDSFNGYYAVYPGDDFEGNDVTVVNNNTSATITLNRLALNFHAGATTHDVVFPMGGKVNADNVEDGLLFKHLTAGFRLKLNATTPADLTSLKVIVYGSAEAAPVTNAVEGVSYTVKWADQAPTVPTGEVGDLTDQDVAFASVMDFDLTTDGVAGLAIGANGTRELCIPVTMAQVQRITVIGYNGETEVFAKSSTVTGTPTLVRNMIYPVKDVTIN